jgi:hypothetical protein
MNRRPLLTGLVGLLVTCCQACAGPDSTRTPSPATHASTDGRLPAAASTRHPLAALTGSRARVVWVQDRGDGTDVFARGAHLVLMGLDTDDDRGARAILGTPGRYAKPLLTRRGDRVVFSDRQARKMFVVDWSGARVQELASGFALATWLDPVSRIEWVYYGVYEGQREPDSYAAVWRLQIDRPAVRQLVWDRTPVGEDNFQLSADGRRAAAMFPWPHCGIADLEARTWRKLADGCWTALAPDQSSLFWYLDGSHRSLTVMDPRTGGARRVRINDAPGIAGAEVYHPRWSNHPRFLVITGPYKLGDETNRVKGGGAQVEIFVGRFAPGFDRVEAWVRITHNGYADFLPDLWVAPDGGPPPGPTASPPAAQSGSARAAGARAGARAPLLVEARLVEASPIPAPVAIEPYRRALVAHRYRVVRVLEGRYDRPELLVAHWAIVDRRLLPTAQREVGRLYRMRLDPYEAHPELEAERLIMESDALNLPLFYDVDSHPSTRTP